jgi:hypothetical protein
LIDLSTIEHDMSEIIKPTNKDKKKTKSYKRNLRETIEQLGDFRGIHSLLRFLQALLRL